MASTNEEFWQIECVADGYQAQEYSHRNYQDECDDALVRMIEKNKHKILELTRTDAVTNTAKLTALCDTIKALYDEMTSWNKEIITVNKRQLI